MFAQIHVDNDIEAALMNRMQQSELIESQSVGTHAKAELAGSRQYE